MCRTALSAAFAAIVMLCDLWISPASAQFVRREEYCSRINRGAPAVVGTQVDSNKDYVTIYRENYGELRLRKADFAICEPCADGKARSDEGMCAQRTCAPGEVLLANGACLRQTTTSGTDKCPASPGPRECPTVAVADPATKDCRSLEDLQFLGSGTVGRHALPYLLQAYANSYGFQLTRPFQISQAEDEENNVEIFLMRKPTGECFRATVRSRGSEAAKNHSRAPVRMSSIHFSDDELRVAAPNLGETPRSDIEHVVGLDAVAIVVNKNNPVDAMSVCDAAKVFADPSAGARRYNIHFREGESGTSEFFRQILAKCGLTISQRRTKYGNYDRLIEGVAGDPDGIGFAPVAFNTDRVKTLRLTGRCGLGTTPTSFNIKAEDYLLSRRLFLLTPEPLEGAFARELLNFIKADERADNAMSLKLPRSAGGSDVLDNPAIDQKIELARDEHQEGMDTPETREDMASARSFQRFTSGAQRLSLVFRFEFGSANLDVKATQDIERLIRFLKKEAEAGRARRGTLLLAGFTDNFGSVAMNKAKAEERARAVLAELEANGVMRYVKSVQIEGFGEILPVACNDPDDRLGRDRNRRVEVYLRR